MTLLSLSINLLVSLAITCLGFWLKGFDSILPTIAGWILFLFGGLGVIQAIRLFLSGARNPQPSILTSGASYEQAMEDFKAEVDRFATAHPDYKMDVIMDMAATSIKERHPQFDTTKR